MDIELKSVIDEMNKGVAALRSEVESKGDKETIARLEAEVARTLEAKSALEGRISAMEAAQSRVGTFAKGTEAGDEYKTAFVNFLRKSDDYGSKQKLEELQSKQVNISTPANGGYAVPTVLSNEIAKLATDFSPIRTLARVITVSNENFVENIDQANAGFGWAGEVTERTVTATPTLGQFKPTYGELFAVAEVSNFALNDIHFDVQNWLVTSIGEKFAVGEAEAFLTGNGTAKPTGILNGTTVGTVGTGAAADFGANPFDNIMDLRYGVKGAYAQRGSFLMNSLTLARLAKVKDTTGQYIYQPAIAAGVAETLVGKPVHLDENMPSVAANAKAVLFGDFAAAYTIADVAGTYAIIVDNVTKKGFTQFYVSRRVGGGVKIAEAIKALQIKA